MNIEKHNNYINSQAICLTYLHSLDDTRFMSLKKEIIIKKPTNALRISHEQLALLVAQNKDKEAFRKIFYYFAPRIKSYLLNFKVTDQKAEELVQEVMLTFWQKADKFDHTKAKLSTWLFRISRNRFIDHARKLKYPEVNADDHLNKMVSPERTELAFEEKETSERIKAALIKLNPNQRQVIELSFFKELSHSEISQETGLPLGTVKSRIRTAFKLLRVQLGDHE